MGDPLTSRARLARFVIFATYATLLAASLAFEAGSATRRSGHQAGADAQIVSVRPLADGPHRPGEPVAIAYRSWSGASETGTVLLLHGSPGSGADFERLARALAESNYRIIAPDLPGFGDSDPAPMSSRDHARVVLGLLDHLHIPRA